MGSKGRKDRKKTLLYISIFIIVNILAIFLIIRSENRNINKSLADYVQNTKEYFDEIMDDYERSFRIFTQMLAREIENNPDPDDIWNYLKSIDPAMLEIEGETYSGLYMYYDDRFLYSWDTPYSE